MHIRSAFEPYWAPRPVLATLLARPRPRRPGRHPPRLPAPRYDLLDLRRYKIPNLPAQTTRGCPYACSYCEVTQVYGARFRYRPPDEVVEEVRTLMRLGRRRFVY